MSEMRHTQLFRKSQEAHAGGIQAWSCMSTGEKVAVALVLNRADWLKAMNYTIPEAIDRTGSEWVVLIPSVARELEDN